MDVIEIPHERLLTTRRLNIVICKLYKRFLAIERNKIDWEHEFKRMYKLRLIGKIDQFYLKFVQLSHSSWKKVAHLINGVFVSNELLKLKTGNYDIQSGFGTYIGWQEIVDDLKSEFVFKQNVVEEGERKCKGFDIFSDKHSVMYLKPDSAGVDMYLMTECNHMIIANSTFSFWGALLNPKKVG